MPKLTRGQKLVQIYFSVVSNPLWPLLKLGVILAIPIVAMLIYGQPGLRIQYWYRGSYADPFYTKCKYLTLFDGWQMHFPAISGGAGCPIIEFFPFQLTQIFGG
ncbi:hypothetical protein VK792_19400 [Mesobacterium sp. TK19101]|uniref:Uncharacterized protein n=1 Tax=Mesobacterium hydrothermale TaxID=3111907 RepID=A0ABU6HM30_9RHOB|nr:hypothetical protein [Mesobacterium sp. TK19101]MEC3863452.1 hypothetical protein [Mesobacterium sp. TK19101]